LNSSPSTTASATPFSASASTSPPKASDHASPQECNTDQQQLIGKPGVQRFPDYFALNLQLEERFHRFGYYLALRGGFDNLTGRCNPFVVNNVIDESHPQPTFTAFEGRAFTSRIRLLGRK
jgi:hypothetical protein